jgi:lipopolysaccharide biosynthesis glycosyltransferase
VLAVVVEKQGALRYWDQDAINSVIAGRWTALPPAWNQQHYFQEIEPASLGYEPEAWQRALEQPSIVHFTGGSKPWHAKNQHPFRARYHHYRRRIGLSPLWLRPSHLAEMLRKVFHRRGTR